MKMPDYNRSLLSLVSSVLKYYGHETEHATLPELDLLLKKNYKNVVVMLFDGMGDEAIKRHLPKDSFLSQNQRAIISSVFPPTTTASTTTMISGLSPVEHGWLGWTLHFADIGKNVCLFPNTELLTNEPACDFDVARHYLDYESIFDKIEKATDGKVKADMVSVFSEYKTDSVDSICEVVERLCADSEHRYIYTYYKQPDSDMHALGVGHDKVKDDILKINDRVYEMCEKLTDTLIIVTADHGLIDTKWKHLIDYPDVWDCLADIPTVEMRAMTFFIKKGREKEFEEAFNRHFSKDYELMPKEQALKLEIFGKGTPHPMIDKVLGEYVAVALSDISINVVPEKSFLFKSAHAGSTLGEYNVPFIVIEKEGSMSNVEA